MNSLHLPLCCLLIVLLCSAIKGGQVCDFSDEACLTKAAHKIYKVALAAFKESPDPIHLDALEDKVNDLKFKLTNINLSGMQNCEVKKLSCEISSQTFEYVLRCPHLVSDSTFVTEGSLASIPIPGSGDNRIIMDDYEVTWSGGYDKFVSKEDNKPRVFVTKSEVGLEPKGKVSFELPKLTSGDKTQFEKSVNFLNENWKEGEKMFRKPILEGLFKKFFDNFNEVLKIMPLDQLLPAQ